MGDYRQMRFLSEKTIIGDFRPTYFPDNLGLYGTVKMEVRQSHLWRIRL
jgi:hypothetical protein